MSAASGSKSDLDSKTENLDEYIQHKKIVDDQFNKFGRMDMAGLRLTCAQIHSRHDNFQPLLLNAQEIPEAIELLIKNPELLDQPDGQKKTIIAFHPEEKHYFAIQLSLADPENPKMLILEFPREEFLLNLKKKLPTVELYMPNTVMQRSHNGCSFFSSYLAQRLQGIDRYLPKNPEGTPGDLFTYLGTHVTEENLGIKTVQLPLALILSSQTAWLWASKKDKPALIDTYSEEERKHVLTKRGELFDDVIGLDGHQGRHKVLDSGGKEQNKLIEHFRAKTEANNKRFLATTPISRVLELEHRTTLEYLKSQVTAASDSATTSAGAGSSAGSSATASPAPLYAASLPPSPSTAPREAPETRTPDSPRLSLVFESAHSALALPAPLATPATPVPGVSNG